MGRFFAVKKYIAYKFQHINEYHIHSPFVFHFYTQIIKDKTRYQVYKDVANLKNKLKKDPRKIKITDYGSGQYKTYRSISDILTKSSQWDKFAHLLYRMMRHYQYEEFIELGCSFGLTSIYLALGNPKGHGYTVDACEASLKIAIENMQLTHVDNVKIIHAEFESVFDNLLDNMKNNTLIYIDGNHHYQPTLKYFKMILKYKHKLPVVVFDDIYHSKEMEKAWHEIIANPFVSISFNLYKLGIIYFNDSFSKQDFILKI